MSNNVCLRKKTLENANISYYNYMKFTTLKVKDITAFSTKFSDILVVYIYIIFYLSDEIIKIQLTLFIAKYFNPKISTKMFIL